MRPVYTVLEDSDGVVWFATSQGISSLDIYGKWINYTTDNELNGNFVHTMIESRDGSLLFGLWRNGIYQLDRNGIWTSYENVSDDTSILTMEESVGGSIWLGTGNGIKCSTCDMSLNSYTTNDKLKMTS